VRTSLAVFSFPDSSEYKTSIGKDKVDLADHLSHGVAGGYFNGCRLISDVSASLYC